MKSGSLRVAPGADDEISALIETLLTTEQRLTELTGGEVDSVSNRDGKPFLLQRAQEQLRQSEAAKQAAILDALTAHVALLDAQGVVVTVNEAWRRAGNPTAVHGPGCAIGVNYPDMCGRVTGEYSGDAHQLAAGIRAVLSGAEKSFSLEYPCHAPAKPRWFLMKVTPLVDHHPSGVVVMHLDITERRHAENALRESNEKFVQLADNITDTFWIRSADFSEVHYVSPAFEKIWGRSTASLYANPQQWMEFVFTEDQPRVREAFALLTGTARTLDIDYRIVRPDGEIRWVHLRAAQVRNAADELIRHIGIVSDITERRRSMQALMASEARFRTLAEAMPQIVWVTRPDGWNTYINQQWVDYTGRSLEESMGQGWIEPFHPDDQQPVLDAWAQARATLSILSMECRLRRADGVYRWWLIRGAPLKDPAGLVLKWFGTCTDIQDRKVAELEIVRANRALQTAEVKYRSIFENSTEGIFQTTPEGRFISANPAIARILGFASPEELIRERTDIAQQGYTDPAVREQFRQLIAQQDFITGFEYEVRKKDGSTIWVSENTHVVREADGRPKYYEGSFQDITDRKRATEALRLSEQRFKALFEQAAVGVAQTEAVTGRFVQINQRFCDMVGRTREEMKQLNFAEISHPDDVGRSRDLMQQMNAGEIREFSQEKRYLKKDGSEVWCNVTVSAMWALGEEADYFIAVAQDITERKRLEDQVRQAQKMDAVGTLAGGIAHDFNNILAAINGYTELSQMILQGNPDVRSHLGAVLQASKRAADLVRQILTFSRQQPLERRPTQLLPVVAEALTLLRATIPSTIEFETALPTNAPTVLADASQVHQILMNLGTNAWHAMKDRPGRLKVTLERFVVDEMLAATQARLRPGTYARVSVSDTGSGMPPATLRRIFEPFFTTKPLGEGTGLGLAVVHGIMDTHEGAITVYSEPGSGTVFHLYFPAHAGAETLLAPAERPAPRGRGERILFVDDEELLVVLGRKALVALGYEVESSRQPAAALALVRAEPERFALVITDQTMPGMTGLALAGELLQIRPGLPIILTTGYSHALTPEGVEAAGLRQLLIKPFTIPSLGHAVHGALYPQFRGRNIYGSNPPY